MNFPTKLCAMAAAIVLAACGGGGDGDAGAGDNAAGPGNHLYHSLDYAPAGDFLRAQRVVFPHEEDAAQVRLGNATIAFEKDAQGVWAAEGYHQLVVGDAFSAEQGALLLCKGNGSGAGSMPGDGSPIWHAVLPAGAQPVAANAAVGRLVEGKRYTIYAECQKTNEVFVATPDGGLDLEINGVPDPDSGETPAAIRAMLSDRGLQYSEGGWDERAWLRVYEVNRRLLAVAITQSTPPGESPAFEIIVLAQQD
ncbi:hypothetical protein [Lampropedia cohaerens]|nr:hypothetical protein [Lampropedia cohaerens]